ncbi:hypothetical protein SNEBB_006350 [Seison nebaliae]|nr:hypothetical protein SNEBB_006350 [Seison nebaliae]
MIPEINIDFVPHIVKPIQVSKLNSDTRMELMHKYFLYVGTQIEQQTLNKTNWVYNVLVDGLSHDRDLIEMYVRFSIIYNILYFTYHDLYTLFNQMHMYRNGTDPLFSKTIMFNNHYSATATYIHNLMLHLGWDKHTLVTLSDETHRISSWTTYAFDHYWKLKTDIPISHLKDLTGCWLTKKKFADVYLKNISKTENSPLSKFIDYNCALNQLLIYERHKIFLLFYHSEETLEEALTSISRLMSEHQLNPILQLEKIVILLIVPSLERIQYVSHFVNQKAKNLYNNIVFFAYENPFTVFHLVFKDEYVEGERYGSVENFIISFRMTKIWVSLFLALKNLVPVVLESSQTRSATSTLRKNLNELLLTHYVNNRIDMEFIDMTIYFDQQRIMHDDLHIYQLVQPDNIDNKPGENKLLGYNLEDNWDVMRVGCIEYVYSNTSLSLDFKEGLKFRPILLMLTDWDENVYDVIEKSENYNTVTTILCVLFMGISCCLLSFLLYYLYYVLQTVFKRSFNWWLEANFLDNIEYADHGAVEMINKKFNDKYFVDMLSIKRHKFQELLLFREFNKIIREDTLSTESKNQVFFELDENFGEEYEKYGYKNDRTVQVKLMPFTILHSRKSDVLFPQNFNQLQNTKDNKKNKDNNKNITNNDNNNNDNNNNHNNNNENISNNNNNNNSNDDDDDNSNKNNHKKKNKSKKNSTINRKDWSQSSHLLTRTRTNRFFNMLAFGKNRKLFCKTIYCQLNILSSINHPNCTKFYGVMPFQWLSPIYEYTLLWERNARGTLADFLINDAVEMTCGFKSAILLDIIRGLEYLHIHIGYHGRLNIRNCNVGTRFEIKLTNFGFQKLLPVRTMQTENWLPLNFEEENRYSPEYDMYAFGILSANVLVYSPKAIPEENENFSTTISFIPEQIATNAITQDAVRKMNLIFNLDEIKMAFKEFINTKLKYEVVNTLIMKHLSKKQLMQTFENQKLIYDEIKNIIMGCLDMELKADYCLDRIEDFAENLNEIEVGHTEILLLLKTDTCNKHFQEELTHLETLQLYYTDRNRVASKAVVRSKKPSRINLSQSFSFIPKEKQETKSYVINYLLRRMKYCILKMEMLAKHRNLEVIRETDRTKNLLNILLPPFINRRLQEGRLPKPELFQEATVCFSAIQNFSEIYSLLKPKEVVRFLNEIYSQMDKIIDQHQVFKIDSINEMFLMASGLPVRNGAEHVKEIGNLTLNLRSELCRTTLLINNRKFIMANESFHSLGNVVNIKISFGVNTGEVVGGVVGAVLPRYTVLGDTVNTASRMLKYSGMNRILVTDSTRLLLSSFPNNLFVLMPREKFKVKGKGEMQTHWLEDLKKSPSELADDYGEDYERYIKYRIIQTPEEKRRSFSYRFSTKSLDEETLQNVVEFRESFDKRQRFSVDFKDTFKSALDAPVPTLICPIGSNDIDEFTLFRSDYTLSLSDHLTYLDEKCSAQSYSTTLRRILSDAISEPKKATRTILKQLLSEKDLIEIQKNLPDTVPENIAKQHYKKVALKQLVKQMWSMKRSKHSENFLTIFNDINRNSQEIENETANLFKQTSSSNVNMSANRPFKTNSEASEMIKRMKSKHNFGTNKVSKYFYTRESLYLFYARLAFLYAYVQGRNIN